MIIPCAVDGSGTLVGCGTASDPLYCLFLYLLRPDWFPSALTPTSIYNHKSPTLNSYDCSKLCIVLFRLRSLSSLLVDLRLSPEDGPRLTLDAKIG
jgi:hypothetical protein